MSEHPSRAEFHLFRQHIREIIGLDIADEKYTRVAEIIRARMSELGIGSFRAYDQLLTSSPRNRDELAALADQLTIGETHVLRNKDHWRAFEQCVLPWILEGHGKLHETYASRRIRVWSAGCSSGEEAYTAAIVLSRCVPEAARGAVEIIGTDLSPVAIAAARSAVYTAKSFRGVPPEIKAGYFEQVEADRYRPRAELRNMVRFQQMNLLDDKTTEELGAFDVIFCRNVLIYFDAAGRQRVLTQLHRFCRPDGYLFLGHAESTYGNPTGFASLNVCNTFIYKPVPGSTGDDDSGSPDPEKHEPRRIVSPSIRNSKPAPAAAPCSTNEPALATLRDRALDHLCAEENAEARLLFEQVLRRAPEDPESQLGMALLLAGSGDHAAALECCTCVLEQQPTLAEPFCVMALVHEALGEEDLAQRDLEKAIYLDQGFSIARFRLAELHGRAQRTEDAAREFRNVLKVLPKDAEERVRLYSGGFSKDTVRRICELRRGLPPADGQVLVPDVKNHKGLKT